MRNQRTTLRSKQRPRHIRERKKQQTHPSKRINRPQRREREQKIYDTEAEGGEERLVVAEAGVLEDGRGVEGDDVDAAELLADHDGPGGEGGAADTRDGEELNEAREWVANGGGGELEVQEGAGVVEGGLEGVVA